ncbi:MAG: MBL fold metallo-hydrolase [Pseudothermotoga sp.]|uniref:MBL fold metallo-hydrolase n=1 Tax=Pseudothermotoga sp. TaxID=2033661 RepID=UPI00076D46B6|nr:MAG: Beta-lactamase domain protein [Thermotoga sp. 50_64]MBC7116184.1 MBL fold metallo-hydrolase [Pseudothermotoga sp.]HBT38792.1 MBL fold metallo-hydrolase [Pseudothermotoga sp.]HCO98305.1 MBL fold metallo-hydrolase [Pseudothermotoga sp.]
MEIRKIVGQVCYVPNPVNIGILYTRDSVVLIDSGIDEDFAKKLCRLLEKPAKFLLNTHSHADHCGGNAFLKSRFSVHILAPEIERQIIESPILEPFYLFGAAPPKELQTRFLMAKPCRVDETLEPGALTLQDVTVSVVSLAGHSPNQVGVAVDKVLFCADALFSEEAIKKYRIFVMSDVKSFLQSLELLERSNCDFFLPSHGDLTNDITGLLRLNRKVIENVSNKILKLLKTPHTFDELLRELLDSFNVEVKNLVQFVLYRSTVHAYLSYLLDEGHLEKDLIANSLLWRIKA